jgi:hypothetical protein
VIRPGVFNARLGIADSGTGVLSRDLPLADLFGGWELELVLWRGIFHPCSHKVPCQEMLLFRMLRFCVLLLGG